MVFEHATSIQKFAGLVTKLLLRSGMQKDDAEYNLYWKSICLLYKQQAPKGLPKNFAPYFKSYMFLSQHPKFCKVLEPNEKSGSRRRGCRQQKNNPSGDKVASGRPSSVLTGIEWPEGCDNTKKEKVRNS